MRADKGEAFCCSTKEEPFPYSQHQLNAGGKDDDADLGQRRLTTINDNIRVV